MYNDNDFDRNDALGQRLQRIGGQMNPSPQLKKAAKTGVLLRPMAKSYTAGTHIRKFTKAVLLYAACIALFLGAILLIPKWWGGNDPVASGQCNHKYVALTMGLAPSCTEGTIRAYRCQYCGHTYSEQDPAPGHKFADGVCTVCGEKEEVNPAWTLEQFGDPSVIETALARMGLTLDQFSAANLPQAKNFLGNDDLHGFLMSYYYNCEEISPMELYYTFGEKCRLTADELADLGVSTDSLSMECYRFAGEEATALLTQYAAVQPTWVDEISPVLIALGYPYLPDTFYSFVDPYYLAVKRISVTGCGTAQSGEWIVFYETQEGDRCMVVLLPDGNGYRFVANCPTDYLHQDVPSPADCEHMRVPATCPYCACDEHVWITSEDSPTCTEGITKVSTCIKCGYSFAEWQDPIPHDYVDGNCTMCGKTDGTLPPLEITIPIPDPGEMSAELEAEIIAASAKQYDEDPKDLSVEFVADLGSGAYAIFLDGPWEYPCMETEQIVHGYLFWYSSGRTMSIYKDGVVYGLTKAYEKGVIDANQVLDLYLVYADQMGYLSVRNPEKMYSNTTLGYHFVDNQICIWVFSAYNSYQYTANDFSEINCIELYESPWQNYEDGKSFRRILLTLDKNSKQYVLDCIQILQLRVDIQAADVNTLEDAE